MKNKYKKILLVLVMLCFFIPEGLTVLGSEEVITNATILNNSVFHAAIKMLYWFRNVMGICYSAYYIFNKINRIVSNNFIKVSITPLDAFAMFAIWMLYTSSKNGTELYDVAILLLACFGNIVYMDTKIKKELYSVIKIGKDVLNILLLINLLLLLIYPNGIATGLDYLSTPYHFFGTKNQATPLFIFASVLYFMSEEYSQNYIGLVLGQMLVVISVLLYGSGTGVLCVFLNIGLNVFRKRQKYASQIKRIKWLKSLLIFSVFLTVGVVFFNIQNFFSFLIVDILGKDVTLSGRTEIWRNAISAIMKHPFLGYGYGFKVDRGFYSHNLFLELLVTGGIIGLILYVVFVEKSVMYSIKQRTCFMGIMLCGTISMIACNISEAFIYSFPQLLLCCMMFSMQQDKIKGNFSV